MKNSSYIKYALGEIALVVIGILIALSINNLNEENKKQKKEDLTISILTEEIEKNLESLESNFQTNSMILDSLTIYLSGELDKESNREKALFISYVLNYNWGNFEYPTLDQELGPSRIITQSNDLRASLSSLRSAQTAADFQLNYLNELFNTQTIPFFLSEGAGNGLINSMFQNEGQVRTLSRLYETESMNNILSIQQLFLLGYNARINTLISRSKETLSILNLL